MVKNKNPSYQEKKFQYSKAAVFVTGAIFIAVLAACLMHDFTGVYDTSVFVTAISVTGGVFGSALVWYQKKAQAENVAKINITHVKEVAEIQFDIYERKVRLQKEIGIIGKPDIGMDDENMMNADERLSEAIARDQNFIESRLDDSVSDPEMQTFG